MGKKLKANKAQGSKLKAKGREGRAFGRWRLEVLGRRQSLNGESGKGRFTEKNEQRTSNVEWEKMKKQKN
jgi:hypothetical protein